MSSQRLNVLVYTGTGSTVESVKHCIWSLRRLLSPNYAVIPISGQAVLEEPWTASCALFVMPGGADLGYCRTLNGEGNRRIKQYVSKGGAYLGLCAGGYYACSRCEFEQGNTSMAVVGDRELGFYPGTCRGLAFPGFIYHSEAGTRAAKITVNQRAWPTGSIDVPESFRAYYNGGGVFVDAIKLADHGVEVLAEFADKVQVDPGEGQAAVVYCRVGDGAAVLTSPHPEFAAVNLRDGPENPDYPAIVQALTDDDKPRADFLKACLVKLGLRINLDSSTVPSLSQMHLSASDPAAIATILSSIESTLVTVDGKRVLRGENDVFQVDKHGTWNLGSISDNLPVQSTMAEVTSRDHEKMMDYDQLTKTIICHTSSLPDTKTTPYWNHNAYFANLQQVGDKMNNFQPSFGGTLLYGEVVTSTNTILEKNPSLLNHLPTGLTALATTQVAGRGRGSNVWVSPPGSLMFSTILRHPTSLSTTAPVVFVQYLMALAIVSGIRGYDRGYSILPVRLKWPNDIYALDPGKASFAGVHSKLSEKAGGDAQQPLTDAERASFVKISGILINTSYTPSTDTEAHYTLVCGAGVNLANAAPTTSLNELAAKVGLPPLTAERLLSSILNRFEILYRKFCVQGFSGDIMKEYEGAWLHSGQIVTVEEDVKNAAIIGGWDGMRGSSGGEERFVVRGISPDWGLLMVEEVTGDPGRERSTGRRVELQSDGNSFDFFKGLLKKKT